MPAPGSISRGAGGDCGLAESAGRQTRRIIVLLASDGRRGAEIEGANLACSLNAVSLPSEAVALAPAASGETLGVAVCGPTPLARVTLRTLRNLAAGGGLVVAYGSSTLPACALGLFGSPARFIYRSIGDPSAWVRGRLHRERTGLLMRRAALVVALWDAAAADIGQLYRVDPARIAVVPNARSPEEFRPATAPERDEARRALGLQGAAPVVAVVGALAPEKRVGLAIESVSGMSGCRLLVVGDGPERGALERRAAAVLGARAVFTGALADVRLALRAADVLALPSATEGMPGVVIEAGLSCLPVAACDVGALAWLFSHGVAGALCAANSDAPAFARAIRRALQVGGSDPTALALACGTEPVRRRWERLLAEHLLQERGEGGAP